MTTLQLTRCLITPVATTRRLPHPKRRNLFHNPLHLDRFAIIGADMLEQARLAGYDTDLILSNLARTSKPRDLVTNAGLTWVVPQNASEETYAAAATQKFGCSPHFLRRHG